jgi:hypothetical protein
MRRGVMTTGRIEHAKDPNLYDNNILALDK